MRRVLITGASGANGGAILDRLLSRGWTVAALLRDPAAAWRLAGRLDQAVVIRGDMDNLAAIQADIHRFAADTVVHLAWDGVTSGSRNAPSQLRNLTGTLALLELTAAAGARHFIGFGSQAEYGRRTGPSGGDAPVLPETVYGAVKLSTGVIAERVAATLGVRFTWLRLFASYGPRDNPGFLLPKLITSLLQGGRMAMTSGQQSWDYLYFEDVARAVLAVIETGAAGTFDLGSGQPHRIGDIARMVRDLIDPQLALGLGEMADPDGPVVNLKADIAALSGATGWQPQTGLDTGLMQTVKWYRDNAS
ncbi:MAG: NAD(P)-dependent oxidoreductase [Niveispirillum sp.]|nr:NAD(P)-dependent oxidoreductase [Niveispirillum sp.]